VELSCKSEYVLLALIELTITYTSNEPLQIKQIAARQRIPERYLEQLLASLRRCGLVKSQRGPKGGYLLAREPENITLLEIISCIEGVETHHQERQCSDPKNSECAAIQDVWEEACQAADRILAGYTLQDLVKKRDEKGQLNLMYYI
jgi:Rrf2 family protein